MTRHGRTCTCLGLAMLLLGCAGDTAHQTAVTVPADTALSPVAWLTGSWRGTAPDGGEIIEEHWTAPAGGSMLGMNRTMRLGRTIFFEYLRLEVSPTDGAIVYHAAPMGRSPAVPFRLTSHADDRLIFENPDHDFPQRVIYERDADTGGLLQRIEGLAGGQEQASEWRLDRAAPLH